MSLRLPAAAGLLALATSAAYAQTPPAPLNNSGVAQSITQGLIWTPAMWSAAFASYMNWNGGHCQSCFLNGSTITGGSISGVSLAGAGDNLTVSGTALSSIIAGLAKGSANGVAGLDSTTHVPVALLPDLASATVGGTALSAAIAAAAASAGGTPNALSLTATAAQAVASTVTLNDGLIVHQNTSFGGNIYFSTGASPIFADTSGVNESYLSQYTDGTMFVGNVKQASLAGITTGIAHVTGPATVGGSLGVGGPFTANTMASTGVPSLVCNTTGQNSTQSLATGNICITATAPTTGADSNYAPIVANIYSANNSTQSSTISPVGEYVHAVSGPNSTVTWAQNPVMDIFPNSVGGGIVDEADLNNWGCDPGTIANLSTTCKVAAIGTLYEGASPYPSQAAIDISGASTVNAQWHEGIIALGGDIIDYATFYQQDGAQYGYVDKGAHAGNEIYLAGSASNAAVNITTTAPAGIQLSGMPANSNAIVMAAGETISWTGGGAHNVSLTTAANGHLQMNSNGLTALDVDQSGNTIITGVLDQNNDVVMAPSAGVIFGSASVGNDAYLDDDPSGNLFIGNANSAAKAGLITYNGEFSGNLTASGTTTVANLVQPVATTPVHSTQTCTTGQTAWDPSYEYRCVATNTWTRTARTSTSW